MERDTFLVLLRQRQQQQVIDTEVSALAAAILPELEAFWGRALVRLLAIELARLARAEMYS